ncbi:phage prohead protease, HK97 family protein [Roseobacter sp. SK209-2-6]|uniref:HK97 family phage prohead protease n=1 Tax=Roseobacter sp. SK209-2-6 TaxID=388739 RepID=UPI0000F3E81E|nr:HK97 family phage prohead protease [Roseobacter sp. SK209-2-6]EBA16167.1 phage prohead protease, HK97 family protein [Roseobacter sp. SK209-2-6]
MSVKSDFEHKFAHFGEALNLKDGNVIQGYASLFGETDQGGDVVAAGAYRRSLTDLRDRGMRIKMLWQHDPAQPIGVWDEIREDQKGLWVRGSILTDIQRGAEAVSLIAAGAMEGLSIGYRTKRAQKNAAGGRLLQDVELWEVSLVTFPMLPSARVTTPELPGKANELTAMKALAGQLRRTARQVASFNSSIQAIGSKNEQ